MALDCGTGFSDAKDLMNPGLRVGGSSEEKTEEALEGQGAARGGGLWSRCLYSFARAAIAKHHRGQKLIFSPFGRLEVQDQGV